MEYTFNSLYSMINNFIDNYKNIQNYQQINNKSGINNEIDDKSDMTTNIDEIDDKSDMTTNIDEIDKKLFIDTIIKQKYNGKRCKQNILRLEVWYKRCGDNYTGKCYSCHKQIICIESSWHCGHIQAAANKGHKTLNNMEPICATCNLKMKKQHMYQYIVYNQLPSIKYLPDNKYIQMKPTYDKCKLLAESLYQDKKITKVALEWFYRDMKTDNPDHLDILHKYMTSLNR